MARLLLAAIAWTGWTHPVEDEAMVSHFLGASEDWLLSAAIMWVVYLALEPAVRARWPHSIVTWNRVLTGRWRDAQVGSEVLLGAAVGAGMWIAFKAANYLIQGTGEPTNLDLNLFVALGTRQWVGAHAGTLGNALRLGLLVFLAVFGLRMLLRKDWLAVLAAAALFTLMENELRAEFTATVFAVYLALYSTLILLLLRFGLVASITTIFFVNVFNCISLGTNFKTWYTPASLASFSLLLGIAVYAFYRSLGGRELIGDNPT
jgi:serine/threonine-protein kinase